MKITQALVMVLLTVALLPQGACALEKKGPAAKEKSGDEVSVRMLSFGHFGKLSVYQSSNQPAEVVLFISGDGGWNLGVVDMARAIARDNKLVIGIDITHYLRSIDKAKGKCSYPPGDLESLSKYVQAKIKMKEYKTPLIIGYSSGATLAYTTLVQAPVRTFAGAISMGLCPDLEVKKPFCKGRGLTFVKGEKGKGFIFHPFKEASMANWTVLQGNIDQVCLPQKTAQFMAEAREAKLVHLPKVGHGFSVERNWLPQLKEAANAIFSLHRQLPPTSAPNLQDLPLVEFLPDKEKAHLPESTPKHFAVIYSGDGGWAGFDQEIADAFLKADIPVVGMNSLKYFWEAKKAETLGTDLARIIDAYGSKWDLAKVTLVGYSFGADTLPFAISRLPPETFKKIHKLFLLGPSKLTQFEFHFTDWFSGADEVKDVEDHEVLPELKKISNLDIYCIYGDEEESGLCKGLSTKIGKTIKLPGGHHFDLEDPQLKKVLP